MIIIWIVLLIGLLYITQVILYNRYWKTGVCTDVSFKQTAIFEGEEGFLKTMVFDNTDYKKEDFSFENVLKDVGKVRVKDIYFKKYPFCRHIHSSIDTALKLKASIGDEYTHIENVAVKTYEIAAEHNNFNPKNMEELKQSLPYAVAISLVVGEVSVDRLNQLIDYGLLENYSTVDVVNSIKEIASKMVVLSDDKLNELYPDKRPSNVVIKLDESFRNGIFQNITMLPKGDFENPFQLRELIDKFKLLNPIYDVKNLTVIDSFLLSLTTARTCKSDCAKSAVAANNAKNAIAKRFIFYPFPYFKILYI